MLVNILQKSKERIQKFKQTGDSRYICQNELGKACFQHDMADQDLKDLTRRTTSDKYCVIKHLILLKTQNMMDQMGLFFDKKTLWWCC